MELDDHANLEDLFGNESTESPNKVINDTTTNGHVISIPSEASNTSYTCASNKSPKEDSMSTNEATTSKASVTTPPFATRYMKVDKEAILNRLSFLKENIHSFLSPNVNKLFRISEEEKFNCSQHFNGHKLYLDERGLLNMQVFSQRNIISPTPILSPSSSSSSSLDFTILKHKERCKECLYPSKDFIVLQPVTIISYCWYWRCNTKRKDDISKDTSSKICISCTNYFFR